MFPSKGSPTSDIWIITERPFEKDKEKGYLWSSGLGYMYDKMLKDAGIHDYFVIARAPEPDDPKSYRNIIGDILHHKPKIIIPMEESGKHICKCLMPTRTNKNRAEEEQSEIFKYCGSILKGDSLPYPHYVIPTLSPLTVTQQYKLRDLVVLDLAKANSELEYYKQNGIFQPLPERTLKYEFESVDEIVWTIDSLCQYDLISNDIETIYPKAGSKKNPSQFYGRLPGYPITVGLAPSKDFGISIDLFYEKESESLRVWRALDNLFKNTRQLGQNFFNFDLNYYEALGFRFKVDDIEDTMIRHHVLWPELKHTLAFQTRQYTREPYYKDDGHGWNMKDLRRLKRYNCLDVCVTMEVFEEQEKEFNERPHLR